MTKLIQLCLLVMLIIVCEAAARAAVSYTHAPQWFYIVAVIIAAGIYDVIVKGRYRRRHPG